MIRRTFIFLLLSSLLVLACELSASQEQELNRQSGLYLRAVRTESIISVVAMTHPKVVRYAQQKGDAYFRDFFSNDKIGSWNLYGTPVVNQVKKKGRRLEVHYLMEGEGEKKGALVAISEDEGLHWFFVPKKIYMNKNVAPGLVRLLK